MEVLIFDTNALYDLSDNSRSHSQETMKAFHDVSNGCWISSIAVIEAIAHFYNDLDELKTVARKCVKFKMIANIGYLPIKEQPYCSLLDKIIDAQTLGDIQDEINYYIGINDAKRAEQLRFFETVILVILARIGEDSLPLDKHVAFRDLVKSESTKNRNRSYQAYLQALQRGKVSKLTRGIKNTFNSAIHHIQKLLSVCLDLVESDGVFPIDDDERSILLQNAILRPCFEIPLRSDSLTTTAIDEAGDILKMLLSNKPYFIPNCEVVTKYMLEICERILEGKSFEVNDCNDVLSLYPLCYPTHGRLYTHDKRLKDYLSRKPWMSSLHT